MTLIQPLGDSGSETQVDVEEESKLTVLVVDDDKTIRSDRKSVV